MAMDGLTGDLSEGSLGIALGRQPWTSTAQPSAPTASVLHMRALGEDKSQESMILRHTEA